MEKNSFMFYNYRTKIWDTTVQVIPEIIQKSSVEDLRNPCNKLFSLGENLAFGPYPEWLEFPVVYRWVSGFRYRDDISYGIWTHLISDKLHDILIENNVTGWKSYPVLLYDKEGSLIEGYHGFTITGRGGYYDNFEDLRNSAPGEIKGIYNINNWDGSDFFKLNYAQIAITKKVYVIIRNNKLKAFNLNPLNDVIILV